MGENDSPNAEQDEPEAQEDRLATYEAVLNKLTTTENMKHRENGRTFIRRYHWSKNEGKALGTGSQAIVYKMIGKVETKSVVSSSGDIFKPEESTWKPKEKCAKKVMKNLKLDQLDRRKKECEIFMLLNHPNVIKFYDFVIDNAKRSVQLYIKLMHV